MRDYTFRKSDGSWSRFMGLNELMDEARPRVEPNHPPYLVTQEGALITRELSRTDALKKFRRAISNREIGPVFRIRDERGVQFTARAGQKFSDADTTNGNENADRLFNWVKNEFGMYEPRFAGSYVCKSNSQHRFGNADDFFFDTLNHQDEVVAKSVQNHDELNLAHVISRQMIWNPQEGWHPHQGDFHGHGHWDFLPNFDTDLACGLRGEL
jgi:hypothetical protein